MHHLDGFSLIESLISLMILSLMLLELDAIQIHAIKMGNASWYFTVAEIQVESLQERLQLLSPDEDLQQQIQLWNSENQEVLPAGVGFIQLNDDNHEIEIFWGKNAFEKNCQEMQFGLSGCLKAQANV